MNAMWPSHFGDYMRVHLSYMNQALSARIEDVFDRSLDERVLIVVTGEFGRAPRLSRNAQGLGRDHWLPTADFTPLADSRHRRMRIGSRMRRPGV